MKRSTNAWVLFVAVLMTASLALGGCMGSGQQGAAPATTAASSGATGFTGKGIALITDVGGRGDNSFNDSAIAGLERAQTELGIAGQIIESKNAADYETNLSQAAEDGYDVVIGVGFMMADSINKVAPKYPNVKFVSIDGKVNDAPNVTAYQFKEQEGSFLAGALAGLVTKTGKVGFVGGQQGWLIGKFEAGYRAGVATTNPKAGVLVKYTGSFTDPLKGKAAALTLFSQGADIVYHASGACGNGVIEAAKEKGKGYYAIGVDSDQDWMGAEDRSAETGTGGRVLTSMVKGVDVAVFDLAQAVKDAKYKSGTISLGIAEGGVGLSPMKYTQKDVPAAALATVNKLADLIKSGQLTVPDATDKVAGFKPPSGFGGASSQ